MPDWPEAFFGGSKTDCRGTAGRDWVYTGSSSLVLCRAGARGDGKAGKLFLVAGERLEANPECPFGRIWEAVLEEQGIRTMLGTEEWELMCRFGNSIGYLDLEMQQKTLALYLEELERAIEQLRREEPEKKRLCWGLGILGGLFLAVVLM